MSSPPPLPSEQWRPRQGHQHQHQHQVSLRGASAREISRDALLQKVFEERELRNYTRRASAAALSIQRVWRRFSLVKQVAWQHQKEWQNVVNKTDIIRTAEWISNDLLRPFLFFTARSTNGHSKLQVSDVTCMMACFDILLQSIQSSDLDKNFCSLAVGRPSERATWLYQAEKLVSLCLFLLAECDPTCCMDQDIVKVTTSGVRLVISLTDSMTWKNIDKESSRRSADMVRRLLRCVVTGRSLLYSSIRKYILKLVGRSNEKPNSVTDENKLITTSAVTLMLRPFHAKKSGINDHSDLMLKDAAEDYTRFILTIPYLLQRLPPILLPALRHESSLLPCFEKILISKEKGVADVLKLEQLGDSNNVVEGIPNVGWALANIINLSTESTSCDSGQFVRGLDFQLYITAVSYLSGNFVDCLENAEFYNIEDHEQNNIRDSFSKTADVRTGKRLYTGHLKPVHQQWHLRELLDVVHKGILAQGTNSTAATFRSPKLLDIIFFYSYMLRIYQFLNPLVGSLPILNMLSFFPGFLAILWKEFEIYIYGSNATSSSCNLVPKDDYCQSHNEQVLDKKQKGVLKEAGDKWSNVLQKLTGKSSDVDFSYSKTDHLESSLGNDDTSCLWEINLLKQGPQGISKELLALMHVFFAAYAHLLLVLDDIEFYEKQIPFTLEQQQKISSILNNLVYSSFIQGNRISTFLFDAAVRCLHLLYERDCRRRFCPISLWVGPAKHGRLPVAAAARAHEAAFSNLHSGDIPTPVNSVITTMPHVFPFEERVQMFREFIKQDKVSRKAAGEMDGPGLGSIEIVVRRSHIVEDGYRQLKSLGSRLKSSFNVSFVSECGLPEVGLDYGGLSKEFLTDLAKCAFDPQYGLFVQTSTSERLLIPSISARFIENGTDMIEFLGRIVGKALYEGILLDYSFSLAFVQKLLGRYSFLDELSTFDPELYRNLIYVKHYDGDVEELSLDFTVTEEICGKWVITELKPGGKNVAVTNDNKLQYVYAMSDYKLNRQMLPLANAFFRGLTDIISPFWLRLFNANEFNQLLSGGKHDFDVEDLKNNTRYTGGYSEGSRTIKLFWEAVKGFTPNERCMLLKFVTSCSRAPLLGFKHLHPSFTIHKVACDTPLWSLIGGQDVDRLPSASTCYNTLKLPTYKRSSTLKSKLLYAINSNTGFELS